MTPKEFNFWFQLLEEVSEEMYRRGHKDGAAGKSLSDQGFKISKENKLLIRTNLKKLTERR